jgi:hypothetical protein
MGKHDSHLTVTERELLAKLYYEGKGPSDIAKAIGRNKGTIFRELSRNATAEYRCYTPCRAQLRSDERAGQKDGSHDVGPFIFIGIKRVPHGDVHDHARGQPDQASDHLPALVLDEKGRDLSDADGPVPLARQQDKRLPPHPDQFPLNHFIVCQGYP